MRRDERKRPGIDDIMLVLQQNRLRWYGHVMQKEDTDWLKKCMEYEVQGCRPRGRPKRRTWREVVQKDCQEGKLNRENAMDLWGGGCVPLRELGPHLTQCCLDQGLRPYKWHLDSSSSFITIDIGRKLGGFATFLARGLDPHLTPCGLGRGLTL